MDIKYILQTRPVNNLYKIILDFKLYPSISYNRASIINELSNLDLPWIWSIKELNQYKYKGYSEFKTEKNIELTNFNLTNWEIFYNLEYYKYLKNNVSLLTFKNINLANKDKRNINNLLNQGYSLLEIEDELGLDYSDLSIYLDFLYAKELAKIEEITPITLKNPDLYTKNLSTIMLGIMYKIPKRELINLTNSNIIEYNKVKKNIITIPNFTSKELEIHPIKANIHPFDSKDFKMDKKLIKLASNKLYKAILCYT